MNDSLNHLTPADADWIAFQYLEGGLSDDDTVRFEACLQNDQLAREALARVVEVTQAVAMIEATEIGPADARSARARAAGDELADRATTPVVAQRGNSLPLMTRAAWLVTAAVACAALMFVWKSDALLPKSPWPGLPVPGLPGAKSLSLRPNVGGPPVAAADVSTLDSGELASLWVNTAEFLVTTELVDLESLDALRDDERQELVDRPVAGDEVDVDRLQAPSWMMAALVPPTDAELRE